MTPSAPFTSPPWSSCRATSVGFFTIYDGPFEKYTQDFADRLGPAFDLLFRFTKNPPPTPTAKNAGPFSAWVRDHDLAPLAFYSGYPGLQVQDVKALLSGSHASHARTRERHGLRCVMETLELPDIQGIIVRGYRMPTVRYFLLKVGTPSAAPRGARATRRPVTKPMRRRSRRPRSGTWRPQDRTTIPTRSPRWKPDYCLNVGITWPGLVALGVADRIPPPPSGSFDAFVEGAAPRAGRVGDDGDSGPEHWVGGFGTGDDHVMVALYALSPEVRDDYSHRLTDLFQEQDTFEVLWHHDGAAMVEVVDGEPVPVPKTRFGYADGITMTPPILGGPEPVAPDHQGGVPSHGSSSSPRTPTATSSRARTSSGATGASDCFKMMEQDVVGFEDFLQANKDQIDPELLATRSAGGGATACRSTLSPDTDSPPGGIAEEQLNEFEYVNRDGSGDPQGLRCPVGAHIRRVNPRGQPVQGPGSPGGSNNAHGSSREACPTARMFKPSAPPRRRGARPPRVLHQRLHREPVRVRVEGVGRGGVVRRGECGA